MSDIFIGGKKKKGMTLETTAGLNKLLISKFLEHALSIYMFHFRRNPSTDRCDLFQCDSVVHTVCRTSA